MARPRNPSTQKFIKAVNPQNKSAFIKPSLDAILEVQKSKGNPHAINEIGAGNLVGMLVGFANSFLKRKPNSKEETLDIIRELILLRDKLEAIRLQLLVTEAAKAETGEPYTTETIAAEREIQSELHRVLDSFSGLNSLYSQATDVSVADLNKIIEDIKKKIGLSF